MNINIKNRGKQFDIKCNPVTIALSQEAKTLGDGYYPGEVKYRMDGTASIECWPRAGGWKRTFSFKAERRLVMAMRRFDRTKNIEEGTYILHEVK